MPLTVLITGCSSGLGRATMQRLLAQGCQVIATVRSDAALAALPEHPSLLGQRLDVRDAAQIQTVVDTAVARFGSIDVLVNNAGIGLQGPFEALEDVAIREHFDVNLFGVMAMTRAVLHGMRTRGHGTIVNIASGAGVFGLPLNSAYCAAKFAVEGFSEALALEVAHLGIHVKLVEPGPFASPEPPSRDTQALTGDGALAAAYAPAVQATMRGLGEMIGDTPLPSADDVAALVVQAAFDASPALRGPTTAQIAALIGARREHGEQRYWRALQERFGANNREA